MHDVLTQSTRLAIALRVAFSGVSKIGNAPRAFICPPEGICIVGIASEPGFANGGRSEDTMYFDATEWTAEDEARAREAAAKLDIQRNSKMFSVHDEEYPLQKP
jgi:hypothetical protein